MYWNGQQTLGKRRELHRDLCERLLSGLTSSSLFAVSCVSYRFFPRFFLGLVFCGFLLKSAYLGAISTNCFLPRKIRRFSSDTREKKGMALQRGGRLAFKNLGRYSLKTRAARRFLRCWRFSQEKEYLRQSMHPPVTCESNGKNALERKKLLSLLTSS